MADTGILTIAIGAACFLAGLYLGERGRRKDLSGIAGVSRGGKPQPATVRPILDAEAEAIEAFTREERERLIEDLMRRARCSREDAEQEADRLIQLATRMGADNL
jgi:hypothetical protein